MAGRRAPGICFRITNWTAPLPPSAVAVPLRVLGCRGELIRVRVLAVRTASERVLM
jgi:hypothetical protein